MRLAYVGRVAVEKNLPAFLELKLPGSKLVVGDGPQRKALERAYPDVHFAGARHGASLHVEGHPRRLPRRMETPLSHEGRSRVAHCFR